MRYPSFYDRVEPIRLYDPLSDFLGAFEDGRVEITYLDCVKLAGHSCPTVAGAYLMTKLGLQALFGDETPRRGTIHLAMRENKTEGVTGVIANVAAFILGAADSGGFKGINGRFSRAGLIAFDIEMKGQMRLTRLDTEESVEINYDASIVPPNPNMKPLMGKLVQGIATPEEKKLFGELWQQRVETILLSTDLWDRMVTIR
jgi:formylmethanofuran dehydrogenase subunit E